MFTICIETADPGFNFHKDIAKRLIEVLRELTGLLLTQSITIAIQHGNGTIPIDCHVEGFHDA